VPHIRAFLEQALLSSTSIPDCTCRLVVSLIKCDEREEKSSVWSLSSTGVPQARSTWAGRAGIQPKPPALYILLGCFGLVLFSRSEHPKSFQMHLKKQVTIFSQQINSLEHTSVTGDCMRGSGNLPPNSNAHENHQETDKTLEPRCPRTDTGISEGENKTPGSPDGGHTGGPVS
jgi:hypothetical protein